jgi:hypothetical protein
MLSKMFYKTMAKGYPKARQKINQELIMGICLKDLSERLLGYLGLGTKDVKFF